LVIAEWIVRTFWRKRDWRVSLAAAAAARDNSWGSEGLFVRKGRDKDAAPREEDATAVLRCGMGGGGEGGGKPPGSTGLLTGLDSLTPGADTAVAAAAAAAAAFFFWAATELVLASAANGTVPAPAPAAAAVAALIDSAEDTDSVTCAPPPLASAPAAPVLAVGVKMLGRGGWPGGVQGTGGGIPAGPAGGCGFCCCCCCCCGCFAETGDVKEGEIGVSCCCC
jgi:hypothetical protein